MQTSILFCCLFLVLIHGGLAALSRGLLHKDEVFGRTFEYCEKGKVRFPKGVRRFEDYATCDVCSCSDNGMECASMAPTINATGKCMVVKVGCKNVWVRKNNPYKRCPKRLRQIGSMVG